MGKSAKIYKRLTRKERKIQASTSAALSSPLSSSSPATSATTRAQKEPTTTTPSVTSKVTKTAQKNSPALIAIKKHESTISNSILRSSSSEAVSLIKDTRKPLIAEMTKGSNKDDDAMDTDAIISEGKKKKRIDGVKAKARRRGEKDLKNRPDYVDIYSGKKLFKAK